MALPGQLRGEVPQRLGRPTQRRHRIPTLIGLDQPEQGRCELWIVLVGAFAATAGAAYSPDWQRVLTRLQFHDTAAHRRRADPARLGHCTDAGGAGDAELGGDLGHGGLAGLVHLPRQPGLPGPEEIAGRIRETVTPAVEAAQVVLAKVREAAPDC